MLGGYIIFFKQMVLERAFQVQNNPYLYIPWLQTEGNFVVVINPRPIPVPNNLHERLT